MASRAPSYSEAPAREGKGERRDDGVAGAGHVGHFIGAVNRYVIGLASLREKRHAAATARDDDSLRRRLPEYGAARPLESRRVVVDREAGDALGLGLVRRAGGGAAKSGQVVA